MWTRTLLHTRCFRCGQEITSYKILRKKADINCREFKSSSALLISEHSKKNIPGKFEKTDPGSTLHDGRSVLDRFIFSKTLTNFYEDWKEGIVLDTAYADSQPNSDWSPSIPVVLALHDTPGCHNDLTPTLNTFAKLGCRVIAPSFPGHGLTQGVVASHDDIFTNSSAERALFVQDFLGNLGIERVDLIIGYGAASYTVLYLVSHLMDENFYRSFSLISPWLLTRPRYDPDSKLSNWLQSLWDRPMIRSPISLGMKAVSLGNAKTTQEKVNIAYVINNLDLEEAGGCAMALGATKIPRTVIFGGKDNETSKEEYLKLCEELAIPEQNIVAFQDKKKVTPLLPGGLVFPEGGYDLQSQHSVAITLYLQQIVSLYHPLVKRF